MNYETLFANPTGRTSRGAFVAALLTLLAATAFYFFLVKGRNGEWVLATLLYPAAVLHARRLHDMGKTAWLLILPGAPVVTALWLHFYSRYPGLLPSMSWAALILCAVFVVWGVLGRGEGQVNRFGEPLRV